MHNVMYIEDTNYQSVTVLFLHSYLSKSHRVGDGILRLLHHFFTIKKVNTQTC